MFEFELPDVGEGVAEGELVAWHVAVGDHVEEDQVLADVETDKAVVDLPAPVAGTVERLHAEEGEVVPVGSVIVTVDADGDDTGSRTDGATATDDGETETATGDGESESDTDQRVFAPPNVRRLARELDVEIAAVEGSGPGGRVTDGDVRAAAEEDYGAPKPAVTRADSDDGDGGVATSAISRADDEDETGGKRSVTRRIGGEDGQSGGAGRERTLAAPATRRLAREEGVDIDAVPTEKVRDGQAFVEPEDIEAYLSGEATEEGPGGRSTGSEAAGREEKAVSREPYRGIRRTIGDAMAESKYTAPHVSHHDTAVVEELVETRAELKPRAEERGVSLTYLPFVLKAVVAALKEYPVLNTELDEEAGEIIYKQYYDIGVAVATDAGLVVPVVDGVDRTGIVELASEIEQLAARARERDLDREEMQGSTFTVTNFGAIGGEFATPIINYPETAILGLGAIEERPVAEDGEVLARQTLPLSLSIDHRVVDGAEGAGFVNAVIERLENPALLLLE